MSTKKGILERLAEGPVVGDGSMCMTLEKRGYCTAGPWTPEAVVEHPEAVLQLHREYARAGADVIQTASLYSSDEKLSYRVAEDSVKHTCAELNEAACKLARQIADEANSLMCACISPLGVPVSDVASCRDQFVQQLRMFETEDPDFLLAEFFNNIEEIEICALEMKKTGKPVALSMRIGIMGDETGASVEECAIRMAKTGAEIVGTNCRYDINTQLKIMKRMKDALDKENLHPYLMCQPYGFLCPEVENERMGNMTLPEHPLAMEPRVLTRIEVHKYARAAWELGVRYIGGCCGFEPHHIRAIAQELTPERGRGPPCDMQCPAFAERYVDNPTTEIRHRCNRDYWYNVTPGSGR